MKNKNNIVVTAGMPLVLDQGRLVFFVAAKYGEESGVKARKGLSTGYLFYDTPFVYRSIRTIYKEGVLVTGGIEITQSSPWSEEDALHAFL